MGKILFLLFIIVASFQLEGYSGYDLAEDKLSRERMEKEYWDWRERLKEESNDAYMLVANTLVCGSRKNFIKAYNTIRSRGGSYTRDSVSSLGCSTKKYWTIARIIDKKNGSNVVGIQYQAQGPGYPVGKAYVLKNSMQKWNDYFNNSAK